MHPVHIGRYRILGVLGQGAMGTVYRGRDDDLDREVAIKVLSGEQAGDKESRTRFLREGRAAGRLQHPNIVTIFEAGEDEGRPYIVMELLDGIDLKRAIEGGLPDDRRLALPIVVQLLAGLGQAHEHGVVHRDVKPSNVFLPRGGPAKITDFGVARLDAGFTTAGTILGTPNYMSPEQVRGQAVDARSDLFSAGLILYELITGERAYQAENVVAVLFKISHEPPDFSRLPRDPRWRPVASVLTRALAPAPEMRFPDARAMAGDLTRALEGLGLAVDLNCAWGGLFADSFPAPRALAGEPIAATVQEPIPDLELRQLPWPEPRAGEPEIELAHTAPEPVPLLAEGPTAARPLALALVLGGLLLGGAMAAGLLAFWLLAREPETAIVRQPATTRAVPPRTLAAPPATRPPATLSAVPSLAPPTIPRWTPPPATAPPATPEPRVVSTPRPPTPAPPPRATPAPAAPGTGSLAQHLERGAQLYERGRYAQARAEAQAALRLDPANAEAKLLLEDVDTAQAVEQRLKKAREAFSRGDRAAAREHVAAGLALAPSDSRLLSLQRELSR